MNVGSINNINSQQNKYKTQAKPSFTSILPVKVFIDGCPSTDAKNIKKVVRELSEILFHPKNDAKALEIRRVFAERDRDFNHIRCSDEKSNVLRNRTIDGLSFLFTGTQAHKLDELGREIGPAKAKSLRVFHTTKTYEVRVKVKGYFDKIKAFIQSNASAHVHERINLKTKAYEGQELGLHVHAKSVGTPGKKGFKITIENIFFRKIGQNNPYADNHVHHAA